MPEIIIFSILVCATYHELKSPFSSPLMVLPSSDQAVRTYNGLERHRASDSRVAFVWCGSDDSDRTLLGISWQSPAAYCATAGLVNYVTEAADEYPAGCRDNYLNIECCRSLSFVATYVPSTRSEYCLIKVTPSVTTPLPLLSRPLAVHDGSRPLLKDATLSFESPQRSLHSPNSVG
ncbi:hypothetical protein SISSUDRAFT_433042 [Sistotremastrum suecicum HHB10207 ss-3]|uniref:Uncharacterized protein n=1 Tax=Sistotremastrum suecicum HHB10207 ss-3 TaxID=1314776 RepID=A0A165YGR1_9AGAM|nr:hypothetical protein SISSUDRAFT_433042 [Sistotremastrum suecicum HHB10207 ss-3]